MVDRTGHCRAARPTSQPGASANGRQQVGLKDKVVMTPFNSIVKRQMCAMSKNRTQITDTIWMLHINVWHRNVQLSGLLAVM